MGFKTKIDYSNTRQLQQNQNSISILPGKTQFGMEYADRLLGPDLLSITEIGQLIDIYSSFSGNTINSIFTFGTPILNPFNDVIGPIDVMMVGETVDYEELFTGVNPYILNGVTLFNNYSGVTFDLTIETFVDLGGGNYSGTAFTSLIEMLDAPSLDYQGDNVMLETRGVTKLDDLITSSGVTFNNLESLPTTTIIYGKNPINGKVVETLMPSGGGGGVPAIKTIKTIVDSTYTFLPEDANYWLESDPNTESGQTFIINPSVFPVGTLIEGSHSGGGTLTFGTVLLETELKVRVGSGPIISRGNSWFKLKIMSSTQVLLFGDLEVVF